MESIKDRLLIVVKERNIKNNSDFGKIVGVSRQSVGAWFTNDPEKLTEPKDPVLVRIAENLGYNLKWLKNGIGPKYSNEFSENIQKTNTVIEDSGAMMNVKSVLESYYKEIDLIKDLLALKQESYGKVIFPQGQ